MNKKSVTLQDIASRSGVSASTVSRVLNNSAPVKREVRERIEALLNERGYLRRPNVPAVRTLKLGLIVPDVLNPWFASTIHAAQEEAARQGAVLAIIDVTQDAAAQEQQLRNTRKWGLDGLIVVGTKLSPETYIAYRRRTGTPVIISRLVEIPELPCILIDYESAAAQAVRHLAGFGHRRIAVLSDLPIWDSSRMKLRSVARALEEAGLDLPEHRYVWRFPNIAEGVQAADRLLDLPSAERPTAVFAFDDLLALGALHAARRRGLRVPRDLSIVGFNDIEMAPFADPPLTTVSLPTYQIGQTLVKKLCEIVKGGAANSGGLTALRCALIVRESTGPCP